MAKEASFKQKYPSVQMAYETSSHNLELFLLFDDLELRILP